MLKVLLVDDEELLRRGLKAIVHWEENECHVVAEAENGEEALEIIQNTDVDIVITDIRMPIMDGIQLMKNIWEKKKYIKVIVISGYDEFAYAQKAMEYGGSCYVLKPIDEEEINYAIKQVKNEINEMHKQMALEGFMKCEAKESYLKKIISGEVTQKNYSREILKALELVFLGEYYCVGCCAVGEINVNLKNQRAIKEIEKIVNRDYNGEVFLNRHNEICIVLCYSNQDAKSYSLFCESAQFLEKYTGKTVVVGVGRRYTCFDKIAISYKEAQEAMKYGYSVEKTAVIEYERVVSKKDDNSVALSIVDQARKYIEAHYFEKVTLDELVLELYVSKSYFCKIFRDVTGYSFGSYLNNYRIEKAKMLLRDHRYKNYEISYIVGFEDSSYFNQVFKKSVGVTPRRYRSLLNRKSEQSNIDI